MSRWTATALLLFLLAGCARHAPRTNIQLSVPRPTEAVPPARVERSSTQPAASTSAPKPGEPVVKVDAENGVISGRVCWEGAPEAGTPGPRLRVHPANQGIADAVIWLVNPPQGPMAPALELQLLQREDTFRPHLQVGRKGSPLKLLSADDRASFRASGAADFSALLPRGKQLLRTLDKPGLVEVRSELGPQLPAYLWIFDHDYFAQTDEEGRFRLPPLPPAEYQLVLWHESWRGSDSVPLKPVSKDLKVKLGNDQGASIHWPLTARD